MIHTSHSMLPVYPNRRYKIVAKHGQGSWLFSECGKKYLDFAMGIATNSLGHCHPSVVNTLKEQSEKLWHVSNLYSTKVQESYAAKICEDTFADYVFFCNSGAEAIEGAIKIARTYQCSTENINSYRIITFTGAFHGRTMGALSATGKPEICDNFKPMLDGMDQVPFGSFEEVQQAITEETCAILVEPIQGESGVRVPSDDWLVFLRKLCDQNNLLLIYDEIQSGIGRTGKMFAHEWTNTKPDIMTIAKGIGSGFPLGAVLTTEEAARNIKEGSHGTTFGGSPLSTAVGLTVWDIIQQEDFLSNVVRTGNLLLSELNRIQSLYPNVIKRIRGKGLLVALECCCNNLQFVDILADIGLLSVPGGENTVRLLPALNVTEEEIHIAIKMIQEACMYTPDR